MKVRNLSPLAFSLTAVLGGTLLASSLNVAYAEPDAPSCENIRDYLDCSSIGRQEDVVFVFDTTGSMDDEIADMQTAVIEFSDAIAEAGIDYNLGLTEYKDFPTDSCGEPDDIAYNVFNDGVLTPDNNEMSSWIQSLTASGGNDVPESVLAALAHSVTDQQWRPEASRIAIIITDAPAHFDDDPCNEEGNTVDGVISLLRREGIVTYVIGPFDESMLRIANETGGLFFWIEEVRDGTVSITSILNTIAELLSCTYQISSEFSYLDEMLDIQTGLIGAEGKTIPYIEGETKLTVTACDSTSDICSEYELSPETMETGDTVYQHTADVSAFKAPDKLTDLSTLIKICNFSTITKTSIHVGECEPGVTPVPEAVTVKTSVDGNDAEAWWSTDPYARKYTFFYAPYSDPISELTRNNIIKIDLGLLTGIGGTLDSGMHIYTAVQASNCSGYSSFSNLGIVEIP